MTCATCPLSRGLAAHSPTFARVQSMARALETATRAAGELASVWTTTLGGPILPATIPADAVHRYPFAMSADEQAAERPFVIADPSLLAAILRETGTPAYVEGDGRLVFVTLDGETWATALAGWHIQRVEGFAPFAPNMGTGDDLSAPIVDADRAAREEDDRLTDEPSSALVIAPALVDAVAKYNAATLAG